MSSQSVQGEFSAEISQRSRRRILSVDDEPKILFTRQILLENAGYEVISAADGEQALHFFAAHTVDLVLLDYMMPGMDGGVVAREMKVRQPQVPIILVSAVVFDEKSLPWVDCFAEKGDGPRLLLEKIELMLAPLPAAQPADGETSTTDGLMPSVMRRKRRGPTPRKDRQRQPPQHRQQTKADQP